MWKLSLLISLRFSKDFGHLSLKYNFSYKQSVLMMPVSAYFTCTRLGDYCSVRLGNNTQHHKVLLAYQVLSFHNTALVHTEYSHLVLYSQCDLSMFLMGTIAVLMFLWDSNVLLGKCCQWFHQLGLL